MTDGYGFSRWWLLFIALLLLPAGMLLIGTHGTGTTASNDLPSSLAVLSLVVPVAAAYSLSHIHYVLTGEGRTVAAHWRGIRDALSAATFDEQPVGAERIWGSTLAYATALGLADSAARGIPFGAENDRHAWSSAGGRWHHVRVSYPMWLPGWGRPPRLVLSSSVLIALCAGVSAVGMYRWHAAAGRRPAGFFLTVVAVAAVIEAGVALVDLVSRRTIEGEIVRLRARFPDYDRGLLTIVVHRPRWFVVVDNGKERLRGLSVPESTFAELEEGERVIVEVTSVLHYVRTIDITEPVEASRR